MLMSMPSIPKRLKLCYEGSNLLHSYRAIFEGLPNNESNSITEGVYSYGNPWLYPGTATSLNANYILGAVT